ncbi:phage terminase small subunit P27 family [Paenibacillus sp. RUD330]|uniref:phage terminase small subunit P27 family n=1 Tax=Paenibacillus sp. RUD330 TaxID=2023772 RepID=UPI000B92C691|nr:phage terminase small subunit P27 family [Paenibacillus sp. RUD330]ASS64668.1 phage terminase small subunit P27 family [Paenibacillus sp. RUD330]
MSRPKKPVDQVEGNITKEEREKRRELEEKMNSRLGRDKIRPPTWLDDEGKKMFRHLVKQMEKTELLTNLDVTALATYCDLHARRLVLLEDVRQNGTRFVNSNSRGGVTHVANPALTQLNTTIKLLKAYEASFGFTVYDRTRIALKDEKAEEEDEFGGEFD